MKSLINIKFFKNDGLNGFYFIVIEFEKNMYI